MRLHFTAKFRGEAGHRNLVVTYHGNRGRAPPRPEDITEAECDDQRAAGGDHNYFTGPGLRTLPDSIEHSREESLLTH